MRRVLLGLVVLAVLVAAAPASADTLFLPSGKRVHVDPGQLAPTVINLQARAVARPADTIVGGVICTWGLGGGFSNHYGVYFNYRGQTLFVGTNGVVYSLRTYSVSAPPPSGWTWYAWC